MGAIKKTDDDIKAIVVPKSIVVGLGAEAWADISAKIVFSINQHGSDCEVSFDEMSQEFRFEVKDSKK